MSAPPGKRKTVICPPHGAERLTEGPYTAIRRTVTLADLTFIDTGGAGSHVLYPVTDNLGSTIALGAANGSLAQGMSYGPFGRRETAGWAGYMSQSEALTINTTETDRSYTGQEGLDAIGLMDYNARLYDPSLGRFLSVDPKIADPQGTQSINPYSYVGNNPLNATDPTGESKCVAGRPCSDPPGGAVRQLAGLQRKRRDGAEHRRDRHLGVGQGKRVQGDRGPGRSVGQPGTGLHEPECRADVK